MAGLLLLGAGVYGTYRLAKYLFSSGDTPELGIENEASAHKGTLDLHDCTVKEALRKTEQFLQMMRKDVKKSPYVTIITGRGLHSPNQEPKIKPEIEKYLKRNNYQYTLSNPGMFKVDLTTGPSRGFFF